MWEVARIRGSRASESTSGVEREPGEVHASRRPQRASSSTKARRPRYVSVAGIVSVSCPPTSSSSTASRRPARAGTGWCASSRDATARSPPTWAPGRGRRELDRLEALAPERFTLAGYSMGGRLALALALRIPQRVRRLVLVSASPGLADDGERAARRAADEALADRIEAIGVEAFAREWAAQPLFAGQPPEVAAAAHADRLRRSAAEHAAQLRGLGTGVMPPLWERLGELHDAGDRRRRRARREVPRDRGADGLPDRGRAGRRPRRAARGARPPSAAHLAVP